MKTSFKDTDEYHCGGYSVREYVSKEQKLGFNALFVDVPSAHPKKQVGAGNTRNYFVLSGTGEFTIDGNTISVKEHDLVTINAGQIYEYQGEMKLFEFNVSPDNTFNDAFVEKKA
jgi:mannose-6-phosphate isomerase-like protein (cupin superfamily)